MSKSISNILKYLLFLLIAVGLLWLVFRNQDLDKMLSDIGHANWYWIAVSLLIGLVSVWLRAKRWVQMLKPLGYSPSMLNAFCSVTIGYLVNYGIPRAGEVSRCALLLKSDGVPIEKSLGALVTERIIDMIILLLLVLGAFFLQFDKLMALIAEMRQSNTSGGNHAIIYIAYFGFSALVLGIILFFTFRKNIQQSTLYIKLMNTLKGFTSGLSSFSKVENKLLFVAYSLGIWVCYLLMMYTSFFSLPATSHLGIAESVTVQAVGTFGYVVPVPGGLGAFHYFTSQALTIFDVAIADGNTYATIVHESQMMLFVISGLICLFIINGRISKRDDLNKNSK